MGKTKAKVGKSCNSVKKALRDNFNDVLESVQKVIQRKPFGKRFKIALCIIFKKDFNLFK